MTRRIGIYPGTFDPVHQGHLAFCLEAIKRGEVDEVVLLPERVPRSKPEVTALSERFKLLKKVTAQFPPLSVISLTSDQFTVSQTLPELRERFKDARLSLLIGSDLVSSLSSWENLPVLLRDMSLVIGIRASDTVSMIESILGQAGQTQGLVRYRLIETSHADVASSLIRSGKIGLDLHAIKLMTANPSSE